MSIADEVREDLLDRFIRYARIDTQSNEASTSYPSTEKQLVLLRLLFDELRDVGLAEVSIDPFGYVTATLPPTDSLVTSPNRQTPTIGLFAHVDTSPEVSGADVRPRVIRCYRGGDVELPADPGQIIRVAENPALTTCVGHDLITADGRTLLGADNKAGVAEIMASIRYLAEHSEIPHGRVRIAFTPDEEIGRGTDHFDVVAFGAQFAYTVDGGEAGEIEDETFSADSVTVTIRGHSVHVGYAKARLVSSLKLAARLIEMLPQDSLSPETTSGREGYVHPDSIKGTVEETRIKFLIRDYSDAGLAAHEEMIRKLAGELKAIEPRADIDVLVSRSYRNMKPILDRHPRLVEYAEEAIRRTRLTPIRRAVRGGTDGSRLSWAGLPTANLYTGAHGFHGKHEWASLQQMSQAAETLVHLVTIWHERG